MIDDLKIAIYEFLLRCNPQLEEDGEYLSDGTMLDHSKYELRCPREALGLLADDLGVSRRMGETEWEAIQRYMENEINADKKDQAKEKVEQETRSLFDNDK